ncbi:hypothetical protein ACFOQM_00445 [Paenibacillus sp. GCM10012307]|uniref:Uncharacterized protein n=1 Tax=Paenibacillus roseus TaxID=2798579 RepID=A0A934J3U4_9BACL|nr:hypothetical protein [Paenibacillus roseus]MBJ6359797.1 hypothetical protein [Paenibacillus roseus]
MKKVWRVTLWSLGVAVIIAAAGAGYLYWKLTSIDLEDIRARQLAKAEQRAGDSRFTGKQDNGVSQSPELPSVLDHALGTAEEISGQKIAMDDAMDAAAILLQSGLSFTEMYSLLGQSDQQLSVEEKQHIRDLLLSKLSKEDIEALKSITSGYGKYLVILDEGYPIEAVGIKDAAKRKEIVEKAKALKKDEQKAHSGSRVEANGEAAEKSAER